MKENNQLPDANWKILVLVLKQIAQKKGITHTDIANSTGLFRNNVTRVFSLKYCPRMDIFIDIARAVGVNFFFENKDDISIDYNKLMEEAMTELGRRPEKLPQN